MFIAMQSNIEPCYMPSIYLNKSIASNPKSLKIIYKKDLIEKQNNSIIPNQISIFLKSCSNSYNEC